MGKAITVFSFFSFFNYIYIMYAHSLHFYIILVGSFREIRVGDQEQVVLMQVRFKGLYMVLLIQDATGELNFFLNN